MTVKTINPEIPPHQRLLQVFKIYLFNILKPVKLEYVMTVQNELYFSYSQLGELRHLLLHNYISGMLDYKQQN